ncbi:hypothetical protein [Nostoc sp.]|uniref:hypothetical protein n=1 Tax=Nostoc sp. TaxID=1180 RepID=UPI002FFBA31E
MPCNAWNHPSDCNCGFGGDVGVYIHGNISSLLNSNETQCKESKDKVQTKTYPTKCKKCGKAVYYHTNGNGDSVFFNSLGYPWQVHGCWYDYWKEEKANRKELSALSQSVEYFLNPKNTAECKYGILAGAVRGLAGVSSGTIFQGITEEGIAQYMSLLLKKFRKVYRGFYVLTQSRGIQLFRPQVKLKKKLKVNKNEPVLRLVSIKRRDT